MMAPTDLVDIRCLTEVLLKLMKVLVTGEVQLTTLGTDSAAEKDQVIVLRGKIIMEEEHPIMGCPECLTDLEAGKSRMITMVNMDLAVDEDRLMPRDRNLVRRKALVRVHAQVSIVLKEENNLERFLTMVVLAC